MSCQRFTLRLEFHMPLDAQYDYRAIKGFAISSLYWGIVGLLVGILISLQLVYPSLNFTPWLTYTRSSQK